MRGTSCAVSIFVESMTIVLNLIQKSIKNNDDDDNCDGVYARRKMIMMKWLLKLILTKISFVNHVIGHVLDNKSLIP